MCVSCCSVCITRFLCRWAPIWLSLRTAAKRASRFLSEIDSQADSCLNIDSFVSIVIGSAASTISLNSRLDPVSELPRRSSEPSCGSNVSRKDERHAVNSDWKSSNCWNRSKSLSASLRTLSSVSFLKLLPRALIPGLGCTLPLDRCVREVEACEEVPAACLLSRGSLSSNAAPVRVADARSCADLATRCGSGVCCIVDFGYHATLDALLILFQVQCVLMPVNRYDVFGHHERHFMFKHFKARLRSDRGER